MQARRLQSAYTSPGDEVSFQVMINPTSRQVLPRVALRWLATFLAAGAVACGGGEPRELPGVPLFDDRHLPDLLTEARPLELPPSTRGNRFLAGWWPSRPGGQDTLIALDSGGRLELVQLSRRPRQLTLDLWDYEPPVGEVLIRAAGRDLGRQPLKDPLKIELPEDLPLGRTTVELIPQDGNRLEVVSAATRAPLAAGDARRDGADMLQTGYSMIDVVRRVPAGATLQGVFHPPASPPAGQEFLLHIERDGDSRTAFHWQASLWNRVRGRQRLEVPLGPEPGLVRVRLEARGEGPAALWKGLSITDPPANDSGDASQDPDSRPKLVILYVMDALRADRVGHLGGPAGVTPTLDRLAREGITFLDHRSVAPNTLPSTKALFTGEAYVEGGGAKLPEDGAATLAEAFRAAGYATAMFSNNPFISATYGVDRGFDAVGAPGGFSEAKGGNSFYDDAERIHAAALDWIATLEPGQPAFLYLHTLHPHNPYDPPDPFREQFAGSDSTIDGSTETLIDIQRLRRQVDDADRARLGGLYAGALAYNDAELGKLLETLADLYPPEQTFLAVTSDHGEELFDHGGVLHGYTLYEEMIRIPLILWSPRRVSPGERQRSTSTLDLHATLSRLAGDAQTVSEGIPLFEPTETDNAVHFAAAASVKGGVFSAQSQRFKLVWAPRTGRGWGMGEALGRSRDAEYLFNLEDDPQEQINRAGSSDLEAAWLRSQLLAWVASKRASPAAEVEVDEETRQRLRALGYMD